MTYFLMLRDRKEEFLMIRRGDSFEVLGQWLDRYVKTEDGAEVGVATFLYEDGSYHREEIYDNEIAERYLEEVLRRIKSVKGTQ